MLDNIEFMLNVKKPLIIPSKGIYQTYEEAGAALLRKIEGNENITLDLRDNEEQGLDLLCGILLAGWRFNKYRTRPKSDEATFFKKIAVVTKDPIGMKAKFQSRRALVEGVFFARNLTSEPPNQLPPQSYAKELLKLETLGVSVEILDKSKLEEIGMTALLAVSKGSAEPPAVVILRWIGKDNASPPIIVVGKGVCFDSGGLCLKTTSQQSDMKWDKAGAGVVAGLIKTLALNKVAVNAVGIIGLVENMPDGAATRPGDVIYSMSGSTIEIVNTDAEGRLVLADCLWYAQQRFKPSVLIDLGTLTPETFASLGTAYAGLYSNSRNLAKQLREAGEQSQEKVWELPMGPYFRKQIESNIADIKNLGQENYGENGAAAEFLRHFIQEDIPWAHLDIAGVSWTKDEPKKVTGFGVQLLNTWFSKLF